MADKVEKANSCGMCRAMGASGCKGHDSDDDDTENKENLENQSQAKQFLEIAPIIGKEWQLKDNGLCIFEEFNQYSALSSIQLNYIESELMLEPKEGLDAESKQDINALFEQIKMQAEQKKGEVTINNKGQLEIDMSKSPDQFAGLISSLMKKTYFP